MRSLLAYGVEEGVRESQSLAPSVFVDCSISSPVVRDPLASRRPLVEQRMQQPAHGLALQAGFAPEPATGPRYHLAPKAAQLREASRRPPAVFPPEERPPADSYANLISDA